jgi:septum formation inhibitor-activating ATPase MinD
VYVLLIAKQSDEDEPVEFEQFAMLVASFQRRKFQFVVAERKN